MKITIPYIALKKPLKLWKKFNIDNVLNTILMFLFWIIVNIYCGRPYADAMPIYMIFVIVFFQYLAFRILTRLTDIVWNRFERKKINKVRGIEFIPNKNLVKILERYSKRKIGGYIDSETLKSHHFKRIPDKRKVNIDHRDI